MNFDVKDLKSWNNRHDVKTLSVTGFFGNSLSEIDAEIKRYNNGEKDRLHELYIISDNGCYCFGYALYFADTGAFGGTNNFAFFLPVDAVKKEKKYRPFKTMRELTEVVRGKDWEMNDITTGDELMIRSKGCEDRHRRVLITDLTLDNNCNLLFMNNETMKVWLDNYEVMSTSACDWVPFGVEIEDKD